MTEIKKLKLSEINLHEAIRFTNDFVFKAIFTNPDDNYILLRSLIHSIIGGPSITSLELLNSEENNDSKDAKAIRYDIKAQLETKELVEIEMQKAVSKEEIKERSGYYAMRLANRQDAKGKRYRDIKPVYSIFLCDFPYFEKKEQWKEEYVMRGKENTEDILTQKVKTIIIEIDKGHLFQGIPTEELDMLKRWIITLGMKDLKKIDRIIEDDEVIEKAVEQLKIINSNNHVWAMAESRYKYETDEIAFRLAARDEGLEEGRIEGLKEGIYQTAIKMLKDGLSDAFIMKYIEITDEELQQIKQTITQD